MAANSELSLDVQPFEQLQCDGSGQIRASAWPTDSGIATASASLPAYHYQFSVDQVAIVSFAPNTNGIFQYTPPSDGTCHTVQVSAIDPLTGCASPVKEAKVSTCVVSVAC
jgi:hypothetical protein